jgi:1-aminocyclopropane-1-carboxylate deaminase/D-cysteine desulfhydrase-like pyridoxal-dependent ACC family enzyme
MNLQQFITETLVQISKGIEGADKQLADSSAIVNPRHVAAEPKLDSAYGFLIEEHEVRNHRAIVQKIDFDVALHASTSTEAAGKVGLLVAGIGIGTKASSEHGDKSESRIKFSIPMVLPFTKKGQ